MDTYYRRPDQKDSIIYGERLATVQEVHYDHDKKRDPDTSYTFVGGKVKYKENFKCNVQYLGKVFRTYNRRIRPLTKEESRDLNIYYEGDFSKYPLLINNKLLKEAVTKRLKASTPNEVRNCFL